MRQRRGESEARGEQARDNRLELSPSGARMDCRISWSMGSKAAGGIPVGESRSRLSTMARTSNRSRRTGRSCSKSPVRHTAGTTAPMMASAHPEVTLTTSGESSAMLGSQAWRANLRKLLKHRLTCCHWAASHRSRSLPGMPEVRVQQTTNNTTT